LFSRKTTKEIPTEEITTTSSFLFYEIVLLISIDTADHWRLQRHNGPKQSNEEKEERILHAEKLIFYR